MKSLYRIALLCAIPMLFSCGGDDPVGPVEPEGPQPETHALTFVLPTYGEEASASLKTAWKVGDKIVVHGEYSKDQVVVTLESGDISSDGKTATKTVDGLFPYVREDYGSTLYAAYPAEAVDNLPHCFFYSKFSSPNTEILAASNSGDNFQFQQIGGGLSFTVDGEYDAYTFAGLKKETMGYDFLQVKLTDKDQNYKQYLGTPVLEVMGTISNGKGLVYLPEGSKMEGFKMMLLKGGKIVSTLKYKEAVEITRAEVLNLGNLTELVEPYEDPFAADIKDLDTKGNANCYIVTEPGKYKFKAVKGNSSEYLNDVAETVVLWETWNNDEEVTPNSVVASVAYAEDYMIIHTPDALTPGNAVVAAKDADGNILWSWHIWVPATKIEQNTYGLWKTDIMDRNLGALVAAVAGEQKVDVRSYGLTYQWGRKDPFVGPADVKSSDNATVAGEELEKAKSTITLEESILHPTLMGHTDNGDWLTDHSTELWLDDEKTIYDPCPPGYKVPARDKSYPLFSTITDQEGWAFSADYFWITVGNPVAVFPVAGYRDDYGVDEMAKAGKRTAIWTAHCSADAIAYHLNWRVDSNSFKLGEVAKARGCSVRCVAE